MKVWTYQLAHHRRLLKRDGSPALVDTSVKTGCVQLAPRWEMVLGIKQGTLTESDYTHQYRAILEYWWFQDPDFFTRILQLPEVAFGCYCPAGHFCHRHILVTFIAETHPVDYQGELT